MMIRFKLNGVTVCIEFSFFAVVTLLILCSDSIYAVYSMYACLLHEAGHLIMMLITKQKVKRLVFYGAGIKIVPLKNCETEEFIYEILVLSAGCVVNFIVFLLLMCCEFLSDCAAVNLAVGLFNSLPLFFLDGGKIIIQSFYRFLNFDKAVKLEKGLKNAGAVIVTVIAIVLYLIGVNNFTIYITLFFLMISSFLM